MSDGYRVNTDELEAVVKRLRALQQSLGQTADKTKYNTVLVQDDFGGNFVEAQQLYAQHDAMQQSLTAMVTNLDNLINDFGDKTHTVNTSYRSLEQDGVVTMNQQQERIV
ncbi:hypothetical protein [Kitasatospora sp. MAP5-34]|uniref:hypothetical protein n=1 Tax=Kitasatospora sp. MAP5-34 TaxID=3035102 RepID=UPI002476FECC|nr:hypothetical protein [Kitasatospora sp. MAP5-34]MDH6577169.1 uncharacterized protein YukE [Kitasatospora sp. MAP5-34]